MIAKDIERRIWMATIVIMAIGLMALHSASYQNTRVDQSVFYDQLIFAAGGLLVMMVLSRIDYRKFYDISYALYIMNIIMLILVLVMGRYILGARRWIEIGSLNFQPSELIKLTLILVLSRYLSQHKSSVSLHWHGGMGVAFRDFFVPFFLAIFPMLLVFKQPDLGTTILIMLIFLSIIYIHGIQKRLIVSFLAACLAMLPVLWSMMKTYQKQRMMVFLNPNLDPLGAGYTIIQSKIAVGSGMLFGKGWHMGTQNQLNFLPERHTDFIFSVIGEELGFCGSLLLIFCFYLLVDAGLTIAQQTKDRFGFSVAGAIACIFALQAIINIGMVMGLFPVVGITLPLVSYGRSSFMTFVIMLGLLLSVNRRRAMF